MDDSTAIFPLELLCDDGVIVFQINQDGVLLAIALTNDADEAVCTESLD